MTGRFLIEMVFFGEIGVLRKRAFVIDGGFCSSKRLESFIQQISN